MMYTPWFIIYTPCSGEAMSSAEFEFIKASVLKNIFLYPGYIIISVPCCYFVVATVCLIQTHFQSLKVI